MLQGRHLVPLPSYATLLPVLVLVLGLDRVEWAKDMVTNVCPAISDAWLEDSTTRSAWTRRALLAARWLCCQQVTLAVLHA